MISLRFDQLAAVTGGTLYNSASASTTFTGVSIDSRTLKAGELFIAIRGEKNDGHEFIKAAIDRGAAGIVAEFTYPDLGRLRGDVGVVAVNNSHEAMLALAKKYRDTLPAKFVGITGSNGKTTTKEFTYRLIQAVSEKVYRSPGNLNNLFGVPLALFAIPRETEIAVLELGISTPSEMPRLASIVRPDLIVITNVGATHLEFFPSVEDVARAKLELVRMAADEAPVILNADDEILIDEARAYRSDFITFALDHDADFRPHGIERDESGRTLVTIENHIFRISLPGRHQVANLLAAYAAFKTAGYDFGNIDTATIPLDTAPMRGQTVEKNGVTFVADCYNANPQSVREGLAAFFEMPAKKRRIVVLGDMLELGRAAVHYHRQIGKILADYEFDLAVLVGPLSEHTMQEAVNSGVPERRVKTFADAESCARGMSDYFDSGDLVYVKASRGIGLEAVIDAVPGIRGSD